MSTTTTHAEKTTKRAIKGGEFGANGEWYEGGKFINTIPENHKRRGSHRGTGKVQIAPYVWEVAPEGMASLFMRFYALVNMRTSQVNEQAARYYGMDIETLKAQYAAWVAGERWVAA